MYTIGDFSKLSRVSIKTLMHYDQLGLLRPVRVATFSGSRYYSANQLCRLNRILALKELGLSLEQVKHLLDHDLSTEQIRGMMRLKQAEIRQRLRDEQLRLERVASRLQQLEDGENMQSPYEVVLKPVGELEVAALRDVIPGYAEVGELFAKLFDLLERYSIQTVGAPVAVYFDQEYQDSDVDLMAAVPIKGYLPQSGRVSMKKLPALQQCAIVIHQEPCETLGNAYANLLKWIEEDGYRIAGQNREVYLHCTGVGSGGINCHVTEVQIPVERVREGNDSRFTKQIKR